MKRNRFESVPHPHLTTSPTLRNLVYFVCIHHSGKTLGGLASTEHTNISFSSQQGSARYTLCSGLAPGPLLSPRPGWHKKPFVGFLSWASAVAVFRDVSLPSLPFHGAPHFALSLSWAQSPSFFPINISPRTTNHLFYPLKCGSTFYFKLKLYSS